MPLDRAEGENVKTLLKTAMVALAAMLLAFGVVACGGGSSSSSSSSNSEETTSGGGGEEETGQASEDEKLGVAAGKESGAPVAKPDIKAGILNLGRVSESGARAEDVMIEALEKIGWSHESCDSGGDPAKMASCGETLLNEGVEALYLIAIPPETIQPTLKRAKSEGVPVIDYAGVNPPSPYIAGSYDGLEPETGGIAGEYLIEQLKEVEGTKEVAIFSSFIPFAAERQKSFEAAIAAEPDIKIVSEKEVDPTNSVGSTEKNTAAVLNQYPNLSAIVTFWDDAIVGSARAVSQKDPGAEFPERPFLLSFDAVKTTQPWIARGLVNAVVDVDYATPAWAAVDQTASYLARKTPISKTDPEYKGITLMEPTIVTKENLPPEGTYVPPPFDPSAFFGAKWETEFK